MARAERRRTSDAARGRPPVHAERPAARCARRVVHLVGRLTDGVFAFLGPATATLARSGVDQVVVLFDDARGRRLLPRFHEAVELVFVPAGRNPLRRWWRWSEVAREALHPVPLKAIHLHGVLPFVLGSVLARGADLRGSMLWSPHALRSAGAMVLPRLLGPFAARRSDGAAEAVPAEPAPFALVDSPIGAVFFDTPRSEAPHPLVVASGRAANPRGEETAAQAAVLLGGAALRLGFSWIGPVDELSRQRLKAADVAVVEAGDDAARAARLAAGWLYLAPYAPRGFAHGLAEAMALGLPCLALDTPDHRELIRDGDTGCLWRTEAELLRHAAALLDDAALRARLGAAAREEALRRFSEHAFRDSLLGIYDMQPG